MLCEQSSLALSLTKKESAGAARVGSRILDLPFQLLLSKESYSENYPNKVLNLSKNFLDHR